MECPSCGAQVPSDARFCPSCGHALSAPRADQRRVVTVVFADLVGFTTLSETRDPEHVKNLVDRCFERLAGDVTAYGGRVDKVLGDAIVALFGAPVAHEDDAERAVRAALQMQRTVAAYAAESDMDVRLRVGVNTGEVLVGGLRAGDDYTAMGDVVNVASRLQAAARPGGVVVGPATQASTREVISYEPLGALEVKGRAEPVEAWSALEAVAPPGYRPRRVRTPLIGRDSEMGILRHAMASTAARRRPQMILISGEAGVGKSRLGEELAVVASRDHEAAMFVGRCVPYGEANPWWPVAEILRQAFGIHPSDPAEVTLEKTRRGVEVATRLAGPEARRVVDALLYLMGLDNPLGDVDPARATEEAINALTALVGGVAARHLVALFLADIHWADQVVLDLVDDLLDRLRGLPVVLVATARPELEERWTPRIGRQNVILLHLDPLDALSTGDLVQALLGGAEVSDELREALLERSGGNPFFVEELVALLSEAGVLDGGADLDRSLGLSELPGTLRGLVAARLDGMDAEERALVEDAAVVGRVGWIEALEALAADRGVPSIAGPVDTLSGKDLLVVSDGRFEFKSDLVREVAYETLTKSDRARRHASVAEWMAEQAGRTGREDEYLEQLGYHWRVAAELAADLGGVSGVPADVRERALTWLARAAARAEERESVEVAEQLYDDALGLLRADEGQRRRELLLGRARTRAWKRDLPGARADLTEILDGARADANLALEIRALTVLGDVEQREGDVEAALATLDQAMALARESGDDQALAEAQRRWGFAKLFLGHLDEAEQAIEAALEGFRALGDRRSEAWALQNLAWIAFSRGDTDAADARLSESAATFEEICDWGGRNWARGLLGFVRLTQGRLEEAGRIGDEVVVEARKAGDRWALGMTLVLQSSVALWLGRAGEARERAAEARDLFVAIEDNFGLSMALANLTRATANLGRVDEARTQFEEAYGASHALTDAMRFTADTLSANVLCQLGDPRAALAATTALDESPFEVPIEAYVGRALARVQLDQAEEALVDLDRVLEAGPGEAHGPGDEGARTYGLAVLSLARACLGDVAGAEEALEAVRNRRLGTYLDLALAEIGCGLALAASGNAARGAALLDGTRARLDSTEDRLSQALVRLARGWALAGAGGEGGAEELAEARSRFAAMGVDPYGWETAFQAAMAAGGVAEAAAGR